MESVTTTTNMFTDISQLTAFCALGLSMLNMLIQHFERKKQRWRQWVEERDTKFTAMQIMANTMNLTLDDARRAIAVLEEKMGIFWKGVAYNAAMTLHSDHTPEFDTLLECFRDESLLQAQVPDLKLELFKVLKDPHSSNYACQVACEALLVLYVQYEFTPTRTVPDFTQLFPMTIIPRKPLS